MHQRQLTAARLRQIVNYCPDTGAFTWLARADASPQWNGLYAGREAGHIKKQGGGYRAIGIEGTVYMAAKLAWLYVTGEWPIARVYYIDGDKSNLTFSNLRHGDKAWAKTTAPFSVQTLRNLLNFDQVSGEFTWNNRPKAGPARVGSMNHGHIRVMLGGNSYPAETLAWYFTTGVWPTVQIIHRNGDWLDNTFANLLGPEIELTYDPMTGAFFRAAMRVDKIVSATAVLVDDKYAAQLAWYMQTGEWPDEVHYRNGDPWDVSFANLSIIRPAPSLGRPGVEWKSKRHCWQARLVDRDGHSYTRLFANRFEAVEAREKAEETLGRGPVPVADKEPLPDARPRKVPTSKILLRPLPDNTDSGHAGVSFHKPTRQWLAQIAKKKLGYFGNLEDAVACRKAAELLPEHAKRKRCRPPKVKNIDLEDSASVIEEDEQEK